jgi:hypothetical protein
MAFTNLPGVFFEATDGNLSLVPSNTNPVTMVLGTASKGASEAVYQVIRGSDAVSTFGNSGSLIRGMYEAQAGGATNINLFRVGATSAVLSAVGGGITIETLEKDDSAGTDYKLFYNDTTQRLIVYRASDDEEVYDNNPTYPLEAFDLGEVAVTGSVSGTHGDIGTAGTPITLAAASGVSGAVYVAGSDGLSLSRMKMFEALFNGYQLLSDQVMDFVISMNVYLDDLNVMDLTSAARTARNLTAIAVYPSAGASNDVLGKVYTEEYQGKNIFWWWFPSNTVADADTTFTSDSGANIFPSVGSATALLKSDGTALSGSDFHEVNFGYQLADFCYRQSNQNMNMVGFVGVLPPTSLALKDVSIWVGKLPTTTTDDSDNTVVLVNGSGLLGNRWMSGRAADLGNQVPAHTVAGVAGLYNGGFIATDNGWQDGVQQRDTNDFYIDIGKYISVVATYPILSNPAATTYSASGMAVYGGLCSVLAPASAPTNKLVPGVRLPYRINKTKLDLLAGQRFITFSQKTKGIVVSDGPTAARPNSDYTRYSTVAIVKKAVNQVRLVGDPFLGEGMNGGKLAALDTAIEKVLALMVKASELTRYEKQIVSTPTMRIQGKVTVELKLVPAFEMRQITVIVSLAAE